MVKRTVTILLVIAFLGAVVWLATPQDCNGESKPTIVCLADGLSDTTERKTDDLIKGVTDRGRTAEPEGPSLQERARSGSR